MPLGIAGAGMAQDASAPSRPGGVAMDSLQGRPTRVRYGVMGYLCTMAYILYIDRICIGQAGTVMKAELGLSNTQWGLVSVAFQPRTCDCQASDLLQGRGRPSGP